MKKSNGFSLIELVITMSIMLIAVGIAAPSISIMLKESQIQAQLDKFIIALNYARSEAIKRNQNVVLCPRATATSCGTVNWEDGWLIYADVTNPGVLDVPGDTILKQQIALPANTTLRVTPGSASNFETSVTYNRSGRTTASDSFVLCDSRGFRGNATRVISVSPTGRPKSMKNGDLVTPFSDCNGN